MTQFVNVSFFCVPVHEDTTILGGYFLALFTRKSICFWMNTDKQSCATQQNVSTWTTCTLIHKRASFDTLIVERAVCVG